MGAKWMTVVVIGLACLGCKTAEKREEKDFDEYEAQCRAAVEGLANEVGGCRAANESLRGRLDECLNAGMK